MSFTLRIGSQDLSPYVRLHPQDGFDPYGEGWSEPVFADAPASEGKLLLGTNVNSREMVWPLFLKGVGTAATLGTAYHDAVVADSPVAWWRLAESSGTSAADSAGTFTGTYNNSPTLGAAAADSDTGDKAVTFTAASSQSMTAPLVTSATDNFSLEAWVKLPNLTAQQTDIASNGSSTGPSNGWGIGISNGAETGTGLVLTGLQPGVGNINSGYTFADTNWHHIVMVRESGTTKFYVDGVLQSGTSVAAPLTPTTRFSLATRQFSSTFFNGTIDEVAVYTTALSSTRVSAHYAAASSGGTPAVAGKDNLHALIAQVNNEIANPTSSPLRVEWKDSGASNSTFYDVVAARIDPHFDFRLSEHNLADAALRVWCTPPYGHTATERIIATAAGTAPGLTASLIGVASPLVGDVAGKLRVDVVSGSAPLELLQGRMLAVSALPNSAFTPYIPAASMVRSVGSLIGASGAPASQALANNVNTDELVVQVPLRTPSAHVGRQRVLALTRTPAGAVDTVFNVPVVAFDDAGQRLGPTAIASSSRDWGILDLGVLSVPTTPAASYLFNIYAKAQSPGAAQTSELDLGAIYLLPEDNSRYIIERPQGVPIGGGDFLAYETTSVADIRTLSGDNFGNSYATHPAGLTGLTVSNLEGAAQASSPNATSGILFGATFGPLARIDGVFSPLSAHNAGSYGYSLELVGNTTTTARLRTGASPYLALNIAGAVASIGLLPTGLLGNTTVPFRMSLQLAGNRQCAVTMQAMTPSYSVVLANGSAAAIASVGSASGALGVGQPAVTMSRPSGLFQPILYQFSAYQPQTAASRSAPADTYQLDWVNPVRRAGATPSDITAQLAGQLRGAAPVARTASTAAVTVICQPIPGPANDVTSTTVRVREQFSYAR